MLIVTGDGIPARRAGDGLREGRTTTTNRTFTSSHIPTMRRKVRTRTTIVDLNLPSLLLPHTRHATGNTAFADGAASAQPAHFRISPRPLGSERFASVQDRSQPSPAQHSRLCAFEHSCPFRYASSMHHPARAGQDGSSAKTAVLSPQSLNRGWVMEHGQISQHDERRIWRSA